MFFMAALAPSVPVTVHTWELGDTMLRTKKFLRARCIHAVLLCCAALLGSASCSATPIQIFESLTNLEPLTNQYAGLTFTNAMALTAGVSLNDAEFPPHSGVNVIFDAAGAMTILFDSPVTEVGGYFTYAVPITLAAMEGSFVLASTASAFSSNLALSGEPGSSPNEFLFVGFSSGFSQLTITGDAFGGSFVLDDLTFSDQVNAAPVPEPATFLLFLTGLGAIAGGRKLRMR